LAGAGGAYSAPPYWPGFPHPLAGFKGPTSKGSGRGGEWKGRGEEWEGDSSASIDPVLSFADLGP